MMASATSSGVWYSLLVHLNGLYACLRSLMHLGERIRGYFGKSAVESRSFGCESELDIQNPEIDMLIRMCVERGRHALSG